MGQNFHPTTCQKVSLRTINPFNTKNFFPEYSFHINFKKSQEISAKLNDSVKSYNKKINWTNLVGIGFKHNGVR